MSLQFEPPVLLVKQTLSGLGVLLECLQFLDFDLAEDKDKLTESNEIFSIIMFKSAWS